MIIKRILYNPILKELFKGKVIIVFGPRQVGKTTLVEQITKNYNDAFLFLSGDNIDVQEMLDNATSTKLKNIAGNHKLIVIDEAQRIKNIGITLKLFADNLKNVQVIATGSSSFELANIINEPLTGRKFEHFLFPLSYSEMCDHHGAINERRLLEQRMLYGYYPDIVLNPGDEKKLLVSVSDSYLYKDLFAYEKLKKPAILQKLLKALALQLGNEVSYNELAQATGADKETMERYINLLEKAFVIFRLHAFSRNVRNELKKSRKIYFYDNGIRNAIIGNFSPIGLRTDTGALWENFLISERFKILKYNEFYGGRYFWRTTQQQEIDYIEEQDGKLKAYEFKWSKRSNAKFSKTFTNAYTGSVQKLITQSDFEPFVLEYDWK